MAAAGELEAYDSDGDQAGYGTADSGGSRPSSVEPEQPAASRSTSGSRTPSVGDKRTARGSTRDLRDQMPGGPSTPIMIQTTTHSHHEFRTARMVGVAEVQPLAAAS